MAGSPMTGGQTQKANPMDIVSYVGNPNHMAQNLPPLRLPGANLQAQQPDYMKGFTPPGISTMDSRPYTLDGKQMTGSSTYINALTKHLNDTGQGHLLTGGTYTPTAQPITTSQPPPMNINTMAVEGLKGAGAGTVAGMGYQPDQVSVAGNSNAVTPTTITGTNVSGTNVSPMGLSNTVTANQLANTSLNPYMNPYTDAVIKANEADIMRGANLGLGALQSQAQASGAYGGSRHGVAMGEIGRETLDQLARSSSGLRQANFQQAQQSALQDIANNMQGQLANQSASQFDISNNMQGQLANQANNLQAQLANQGMNYNVQQANQGANMQGQLANQSAGLRDISNRLQASLANQSAGLQGAQQRLGASNQLGQLANLGFGMGQQVNQNLATQGAMQQALQQMVMDNAANKFNTYAGFPAAGLPYLNNALSNTPSQNVYNQTTTQTKTPGLFDYLSLGASGYTGGN